MYWKYGGVGFPKYRLKRNVHRNPPKAFETVIWLHRNVQFLRTIENVFLHFSPNILFESPLLVILVLSRSKGTNASISSLVGYKLENASLKSCLSGKSMLPIPFPVKNSNSVNVFHVLDWCKWILFNFSSLNFLVYSFITSGIFVILSMETFFVQPLARFSVEFSILCRFYWGYWDAKEGKWWSFQSFLMSVEAWLGILCVQYCIISMVSFWWNLYVSMYPGPNYLKISVVLTLSTPRGTDGSFQPAPSMTIVLFIVTALPRQVEL